MRTSFGVIVVLVLAVALWFGLTQGDEAGTGPAMAPATIIEPAPEPVATPAAAAREPQQRTAVPESAADMPDDQFLYCVRVVRSGSEQPIAAAIVRWSRRETDALTEEQRLLQRQDPEAFLSLFGESATTTADGRAVCRGPLQSLLVTARRDGLFGRCWLTAQEFRPDGPPVTVAADTEFVVEVHEDRTLTVRAIDGAGRPVPGIDIALTRFDTAGNGEIQRTTETMGPTDADGLARRRHAQELARDRSPATVAAALFGGRSEAVAVDLSAIPEAPIDVRLPPVGSLDLTLFGADGRPWLLPEGSDVRVTVRRAGESRSGLVTRQNTVQLGADGKSTATPILCGLTFDVRVWCGVTLEQTVAGPQRDGERVAVALRMPVDAPVLIARILDDAGRPNAGPLILDYEHRGDSGSLVAATAADGRLRVVVTERLLDATPTITLTRRDDNHRAAAERVSIALRAPLARGVNDLGDLTLRAPPLLVAGRVQWPDGAAVEPPEIVFERTRRNSADRWEHAADAHIELPGDGQFVARAVADGRRWRLRVHGNFVPRTQEFEPGSTDLVIGVEKSAFVTARFLFDEGAPWRDLEYRLLPATSAADAPDTRGGRGMPVEKGGSVTCLWGTLAAGPYRLTVDCPGVEPPLVDLTVDVPGGATATDPRLQNIDLRGRVRRFDVSVTDVSGAAVRSKPSGVWIRGPDDPRAVWYGRALDPEGRVSLISHRPLDLQIHAAGFLTRDVDSVFADTVVSLDTAPRIPVRLVDALAACPEGTIAQLDCRPPGNRDAQRNRMLHRRSILDADGAAEIVLGSDSPLQLSLLLRRGRKSAPVELRPATLDPQTVSPGQVVELRIGPEALRQAIEALGE